MAATNIFYRIPSQRGTRLAAIAGTECTLHQFCDYIIDSEGLNLDNFIIASGTKVFRPSSCSLQSISLQNNSHVDILIPLLGGKGGFGSLLRAIGAQIEKTTNRDACRDLSGRRLRDVKREDELRKLIALQKELQEERKRRRKEKIEKLKKKNEASTTSVSIQELVSMFDDQDYSKRRLELGDIIEAAVEKGVINFKKRQQDDEHEEQRSKKSRIDDIIPEEEGTNSKKVTTEEDCGKIKSITCEDSKLADGRASSKLHSKTKKNDLWLGLDDDDF